jgi:hypothetical protein
VILIVNALDWVAANQVLKGPQRKSKSSLIKLSEEPLGFYWPEVLVIQMSGYKVIARTILSENA